MFFKIIILKKICKFHRETPALESSLIKLQALRTQTLLKSDSKFQAKFAKFLRISFDRIPQDDCPRVYLRTLSF